MGFPRRHIYMLILFMSTTLRNEHETRQKMPNTWGLKKKETRLKALLRHAHTETMFIVHLKNKSSCIQYGVKQIFEKVFHAYFKKCSSCIQGSVQHIFENLHHVFKKKGTVYFQKIPIDSMYPYLNIKDGAFHSSPSITYIRWFCVNIKIDGWDFKIELKKTVCTITWKERFVPADSTMGLADLYPQT